jgi:hypothetical protein
MGEERTMTIWMIVMQHCLAWTTTKARTSWKIRTAVVAAISIARMKRPRNPVAENNLEQQVLGTLSDMLIRYGYLALHRIQRSLPILVMTATTRKLAWIQRMAEALPLKMVQ